MSEPVGASPMQPTGSLTSVQRRRAWKRQWRIAHLEQERRRRASYRSTCPDCGGTMSGGHGKAKEPKRCLACENARREPEHGTDSRYSSTKWKCRCGLCRAAHAAAHLDWVRRSRAQEASS